MAQSKPDLISRQELLTLIHDHAEAIKDDSPLQYAILAYWATVVEALPAKAVLVDLVHCQDCAKAHPELCHPPGMVWCAKRGNNVPADGYCHDGERRADHGKK